MKKAAFTLLLSFLAAYLCQAQSKVFKEIDEEISSQMNTIVQDGSLVGYLVFTQLEKASADSFNYKITIMDENLNEIGAINFREQKLSLKSVSFEQDVLCLAYLKSNFIGVDFKTWKENRNAIPKAQNYVFTQFLSLQGKIIKSNAIKAEIKLSGEMVGNSSRKNIGEGKLKQDIQLRNLSGKGFACFYGDETKNNLVIYNTAGNQTWKVGVKEEAEGFAMLTSGQDVYLAMKKKDPMLEGGFDLLWYNTKDSTVFPKYSLKDKQGNSLKVLVFDNDPVTGKPYMAGNIISPTKGNQYLNANQLARGPYTGLFTINFTGHKRAEIQENFSYWADGSQSAVSTKGKFTSNEAYAHFTRSFKDYQGNTYFMGSSVIRRPKWVAIGFTVITSPLIIPSLGILGLAGTQKAKVKDAVLIKQSSKGAITFESAIPANNTSFYRGIVPLSFYDNRGFYKVSNSETKTDYVIVDDVKDITIYNVNQKKVARSIPHKDGNIQTYIFPAKEGHMMVSEYNKKEKYTRYSIESL